MDDSRWLLVFAEDFARPAELGTFLNATSPYIADWTTYDQGTRDTSGDGLYDPAIVSAHDSVLDLHLHTGDDGEPRGVVLVPCLDGSGRMDGAAQLYGRYAVRARSDALPHFGLAFMLWSARDHWPDGEINFPEGATGGVVHGFVHEIGHPERNALIVELTVSLTDWHEYVIEWTPGRVDLLLDGRVVGTSDQSPAVPMRWTLQVGTTGGRPDPVVAGHLQIDRVAVWSLA